VGDGEGLPRRVFQKPVKVFPSENTKFVGLHSAGVQIHTHTLNPTHCTKNTHQWSTVLLWFNAFFDWVGLRPTPDFLCSTLCLPQLHECMHTHTYTHTDTHPHTTQLNEPFNTPTSSRVCESPRQCLSPSVSNAFNTPTPHILWPCLVTPKKQRRWPRTSYPERVAVSSVTASFLPSTASVATTQRCVCDCVYALLRGKCYTHKQSLLDGFRS